MRSRRTRAMRRVAAIASQALGRASGAASCHRSRRWLGTQRIRNPPTADDAGAGTGRPPRVGVPRDLPSTPPPFEPDTALEPCSAADRETMFRQIVKRRAYPVGCASRCRHGYPRAFLHAPMHAPKPPNKAGAEEVTPSCPEAAGARAEHAIGWLTCPLLNEAIDALEWAASHFQAVGDREAECGALCELGLVLLDAGLFGDEEFRVGPNGEADMAIGVIIRDLAQLTQSKYIQNTLGTRFNCP